MNSDTNSLQMKMSKLSDRLKNWASMLSYLMLVGYFYSSGLSCNLPSLEETKEIRILIGISISHDVLNLINEGNSPNTENIIHS